MIRATMRRNATATCRVGKGDCSGDSCRVLHALPAQPRIVTAGNSSKPSVATARLELCFSRLSLPPEHGAGQSSVEGGISTVPTASAGSRLLILDVNGLLLWRARKGRDSVAGIPRPPDARVSNVSIYLRPHAQSFFSWCLQHFTVVVWSTAMARNVAPLVDLIFDASSQGSSQGSSHPAAVLDNSHCEPTGMRHPENRHKPLVLKRLSAAWQHERVAALGPFCESNTVLLDDSPYKAARNPPHTSLHPPEWTPLEACAERDGALASGGKIRSVLAELACADDMREVVRRVNGSASDFWSCPSADGLYRRLRERDS